MASKLGLKLKAKKKGLGDSRSNTPNESAASMNDTKVQPTIDEVLTGDDIEALRIKEEDLSKLHPVKPVHKTQRHTQPVVVQAQTIQIPPKRSSTKSVAVLHPLPPGYKAKKTKVLGSFDTCPRYDENSQLVGHSILGNIDEFSNARAMDKMTSMDSRLSPDAAQLTTDSSRRQSSKIQQTMDKLQSRETNALNNWDRNLRERRKLQDNLARRICSESERLVMHYGDHYRGIQESRAVIDRAIPPNDQGKGFYSGSEFWRPQVQIGDDAKGIRTTLTLSEKGQHPDIEYITTPLTLTTEKTGSSKDNCTSRTSAWKSSEYLLSRQQQLNATLSEREFKEPPKIHKLHVKGHTSKQSALAHSQHTSSLDSLGNESASQGEDSEDNDDEDSLLQSASILDVHPDVVTPPITGPAMKLDKHLLKWEGDGSAASLDHEETHVRLIFDTNVHESVESHVNMENCGTVAIYYSWKRVPKPNPLGTRLAGRVQRFYFDTREGVLLPGQRLSVRFTFKSGTPGIYSECWAIETGPVLCGGRPILVTLRGVAFQPDIYKEKREQIERDLAHKVAEYTARRIVNRIVDAVHTPPRVQSPLITTESEESRFLVQNPSLHYHYNTVQELKTLYTEALHPSPPEETHSEQKGKKDEKGKKEKGGKEKKDSKGSKTQHIAKEESMVKEATPAGQEVAPPPEIDIPPWNLSLNTLQQIILNIDFPEVREEKLVQFNEKLTLLSRPKPPTTSITNYTLSYSVLCGAVDDMVQTTNHLRQIMGLPSKDIASSHSEDATGEQELAPVPSSPIHVAHGGGKGKKAKGKESSKEKEKEGRPPSKKQKPPTRKGSFKGGNVKSTGPPFTPEPDQAAIDPKDSATKVHEVDPILNEKYKQNLHSLVYSILCTAVDDMSELMDSDD